MAIWKAKAPKWQRDLDEYLGIYSTFLVQGYVNDLQPLPASYSEDVIENNVLQLAEINEWFNAVYGDERRGELGMNVTDNQTFCVIGYDPTRSSGKRFDFYIDDETVTDGTEQADRAADSDKPENPFAGKDYDKALFYDLLHDEHAEETLSAGHNAGGLSLDLARIHHAVSGGLNNEKPYMFVVRASRLSITPGSVGNDDEQLTFSVMFTISNLLDTMRKGEKNKNRLIIVANKINDIPAWVENEQYNHTIKKLYVAKPSMDERKMYFDTAFVRRRNIRNALKAHLDSYGDKAESRRESLVNGFASNTDGFSMRELEHIKRFAECENTHFGFDNIGLSVSRFKSGCTDNPWASPDIKKKIINLKAECEKTIKGQDRILTEAQRIMALAVTEVNRTFTPNAPRATLFLAGPTGTGKTELAKQITKLVFGRADRMKRFDMSEFRQDHSDARLFGAPPGYVGFEAGGELTEYVKQYPFSLVLFDEIEKACGSIMDKFLQILSDGRLTDGQGETVDFSNTIIVMTSNAGVRDPREGSESAFAIPREKKMIPVRIDDMRDAENEYLSKKGIDESSDYINLKFKKDAQNPDGVDYLALDEKIKHTFNDNLEKHFGDILGRPELYGRIKESIICYNFISADAARDIALQYIDRVNNDVEKRTGMKISMQRSPQTGAIPFDPVKNKIVRDCVNPKVRELGARGVIEHVKTAYAGTLATFLLENEVGGKTATVSLDQSGNLVWRI